MTDDALFAAAGPDLMKISPQGQILKRVTLPRPVSAYTRSSRRPATWFDLWL